MKPPPPRRPLSRFAVPALALALLALGSGCVAWDPIFRGTASLAALLRLLFH
ncbi:MAG: hypothetical protein AAGG38_13085 [Planctomycetota bacterium]